MLSYLPPAHKTCNDCGETKSHDEFSRQSRGDGFQSYCKVCHYARNSGWAKANRDAARARVTRWREANPDYHADWYSKNREKRTLQIVEWQSANPDKVAAIARAYRQRNPHKVREFAVKRRARKAAAVIDPHVTTEWLFERDGDLCHYCLCRLSFAEDSPTRAHLEHKTPLSRGGDHSEANCVLACRSCNVRKHTKTAEEFLASL